MNDGGPAFPHIDSGCGRFELGMTLRDYFAAKAMQAMCSKFWPDANDRSEVAKRSYAMADRNALQLSA